MVTIRISPDAQFRREAAQLEKKLRKMGGKLNVSDAAIQMLEEHCNTKIRAYRHPVTRKSVAAKVKAKRSEVVIEAQLENEHSDDLWSFLTK